MMGKPPLLLWTRQNPEGPQSTKEQREMGTSGEGMGARLCRAQGARLPERVLAACACMSVRRPCHVRGNGPYTCPSELMYSWSFSF